MAAHRGTRIFHPGNQRVPARPEPAVRAECILREMSIVGIAHLQDVRDIQVLGTRQCRDGCVVARVRVMWT